MRLVADVLVPAIAKGHLLDHLTGLAQAAQRDVLGVVTHLFLDEVDGQSEAGRDQALRSEDAETGRQWRAELEVHRSGFGFSL
ncbi:MAG TPA: hypothetical protein VFA79_15080, partial [Myxococcales bacterium]|nr:hypothetical protein [Myxococcales bacterium]